MSSVGGERHYEEPIKYISVWPVTNAGMGELVIMTRNLFSTVLYQKHFFNHIFLRCNFSKKKLGIPLTKSKSCTSP